MARKPKEEAWRDPHLSMIASERDATGLVTYALIKQKEAESIAEYRIKNPSVRQIPYEIYEAFYDTTKSFHKLYHDKANEVLHSAHTDGMKTFFSDRISDVHDKVCNIQCKAKPEVNFRRHFFGFSFWQNVVAAVVTPWVLLLMLYFIGLFFGKNPSQIVNFLLGNLDAS